MSDHGDIDVKSSNSDEGHDEDFSVNAFLSPLGGGVEDDDHEELRRSRTLTEEERTLSTHQRMQQGNTFSLTFDSTNIPFEYILNAEGRIVVSFVSKPIDTRLNRGVIVLGVDDELLPLGSGADDVMRKLLTEGRVVPFSVLFCAEEHEIDNYEEEESLDIDDNSGSFDLRSNPDADVEVLDEDEHHGQDQYQHELQRQHQQHQHELQRQHQQHQHELQQGARQPDSSSSSSGGGGGGGGSSAASLLKSSVLSMSSSLASKYLHLRGGSGEAPAAATAVQQEQQQQHQEEEQEEQEHEQQRDEEDGEEVFAMDNMFDLLLPGRSPPFVFDLHADGSSVVVVKLVGSRDSADPRLREGCVVRGINGRPVYCTCRQDFDRMLAAVQTFPLRMTLEHAPSLYRHQDALALFAEASSEPAIHMFTVLPYKTDGPGGPGAEGVFDTARRARDVLQAFRAQGIAASLVSIETVLVRENASAYAGMLNLQAASQSYSSYVMSSTHTVPLLRAIRVWFRFPEVLELVVAAPLAELSLLEVTKDGSDGGWIVIRCVGASAWLEAGMVLGRPYLLTHCNGYDTSCSGYRSIEARIPGDGSWEHSVLPFLHEPEVRFTLV